jgi:hypothetical protein
MRSFSLLIFSTLFLAITCFTSCSNDDEVEVPNEEEVITEVIYTLISQTDPTDIVVFTFLDADGEGGADGTSTTLGNLKASTAYNGTITFTNTIEGEDITEEIDEERDEHQIFFETTVSGMTLAYTDEDSNGFPVGLTSTATTDAAGTGTLKITLRHEPAKDADGVAAGDIANAGGETDIEVTFDVTVE